MARESKPKRVSRRVAEATAILLWAEGFDPGDDVDDYWLEAARTNAETVLALIDAQASPPSTS